ncbi:hypothetical protein BWK60_10875 [Flavobacterium covae]|nr:hypothetical protein BWK60_10875 [Flavobacterium covae]
MLNFIIVINMKLIYSDNIIESYSENKINGDGVIDIFLNENEPLIIYNLDGSEYEIFKLLDDSYTMMYNNDKIIARRFVPNHDFFYTLFDCNQFNEEDEYIYIYVNNEQKKIKKNQYDFTFQPWSEFISNEYIGILPNNPLIVKSDDNFYKSYDSINEAFKVEKIEEDTMWLKSTSTGCCGSNKDLEGFVKWKEGNMLLIDLNIFD